MELTDGTAAHGATEINIHSPDTDVFILSLRRYPELCEETKFCHWNRSETSNNQVTNHRIDLR